MMGEFKFQPSQKSFTLDNPPRLRLEIKKSIKNGTTTKYYEVVQLSSQTSYTTRCQGQVGASAGLQWTRNAEQKFPLEPVKNVMIIHSQKEHPGWEQAEFDS